MKGKQYAVYKGDCFLCIGTAKECAKYLNMKPRTIYFLSSPAQRKRAREKCQDSNSSGGGLNEKRYKDIF